MIYLLDTNICIYLIKHQPPEVKKRFSTCFYGDVGISSITLGELQYGVEARPESREQNQRALDALLQDLVVAPFDEKAAVAYGRLRAGSPKGRRDALDKLIAGHALALGVTLVTNNVRDFERYPGLKLQNWVS